MRRGAALALAAAVTTAVSVGACFDASTLPPFPCAIEDAACPDGYVCDRHLLCQEDASLACVPTTEPCDLVCQNGCGEGAKCTIYDATGTPICGGWSYTTDGDGSQGVEGEGEACTVDSDCLRGLYCTTFGYTNQCARFCHQDADCSPNTYCVLSIGSAGICSLDCKPLTGHGCVSGSKCDLGAASAERVYAVCELAGAATDDQPCVTPTDCASGYQCVMGPSGATTCEAWCVVGGAPCKNGRACTPLNANGFPLMFEGKQYGGCL